MNMRVPGISDSLFIRGEVPMTKEEIRVLSISKLHLSEDSVLVDVGCGTGSISVEAALLSPDIKVFSLDCNEEALELTAKNAEKFGVKNIQTVKALAPEGFEKLPEVTHAFVGGTKGQLENILKALYEKNPSMRVVINAVSMESISEINSLIKEMPVLNVEILQVQVNRASQKGSYNLLCAGNPVFIFAFDFKA